LPVWSDYTVLIGVAQPHACVVLPAICRQH